MLVRKPDDEGFGLVEMIIAFFLLAIIAVAILPALYGGIANASRQSDTASATRQLNALIESARQQAATGSCTGVMAAVATHRYRGGVEVSTSVAPFDFQTTGPAGYSCTVGATNTVTLQAVDQSGANLAIVTATILVTS